MSLRHIVSQKLVNFVYGGLKLPLNIASCITCADVTALVKERFELGACDLTRIKLYVDSNSIPIPSSDSSSFLASHGYTSFISVKTFDRIFVEYNKRQFAVQLHNADVYYDLVSELNKVFWLTDIPAMYFDFSTCRGEEISGDDAIPDLSLDGAPGSSTESCITLRTSNRVNLIYEGKQLDLSVAGYSFLHELVTPFKQKVGMNHIHDQCVKFFSLEGGQRLPCDTPLPSVHLPRVCVRIEGIVVFVTDFTFYDSRLDFTEEDYADPDVFKIMIITSDKDIPRGFVDISKSDRCRKRGYNDMVTEFSQLREGGYYARYQ